jgi:hypothetical protein
MTEYKGYRIEPFEPMAGRWRARISRPGGKKMEMTVPPSVQPFFDTVDTMWYGLAKARDRRRRDELKQASADPSPRDEEAFAGCDRRPYRWTL